MAIGPNVGGLLDGFWQLTVDGIGYGAIYALVAVGYTLVYSVVRVINLAHAEVFMLGMFGQYAGLLALGFRPSGDTYRLGVPATAGYLVLAMLAGMAVAGVASVGLDRAVYRPLRRRGADRLAFLIAAVGMTFVLQELVHLVLPQIWPALGGDNAQQPIRLVEQSEQFRLFSAPVTNLTIIVVLVAAGLTVGLDLLLRRTRLGRGVRAVAQDPQTAELMGVSRERVVVLTFLVGGLLAGAAALLYTLRIPSGIVYSGGFLLGIKALTAAVLGGIGNVRGALAGGLLLGVLEMYGQVLFGTEWRDVVTFAVLVAVLLVRPSGILGDGVRTARA